MGFFNDPTVSQVFGEATAVMQNATLKNPNAYIEAMVFEALRKMPRQTIREFAASPEAKVMVEEEIISADTLANLAFEGQDINKKEGIEVAVCHMARENDDEEWNELVRLRMAERNMMDRLIARYHDKADALAESVQRDVLDKYIPRKFRVDL